MLGNLFHWPGGKYHQLSRDRIWENARDTAVTEDNEDWGWGSDDDEGDDK